MPLTQLIIPPREADIGNGLKVRRLLPYRERRMVGPFIFLDHMGPAEFAPQKGVDVPPHPHIGLSTLTYLFEGETLHRDTLGSKQLISPGDVNWMAAGSGIAHSERTGAEERGKLHRLHGLQSWIALPKEYEEKPPAFYHYAANDIPRDAGKGVSLRVVAGKAYGAASPVDIFSPLFYVEAKLGAGATLELPEGYPERGAYVIDGELRTGGQAIIPHHLAVFETGKVALEATTPAHVMLLGGAPLSEPRYIWWNFVSSSKDRLEQARADWRDGRFGKIPGDAVEFVPLPQGPGPGNIL